MTTLAEACKAAGLASATELTRITSTSKETLTNWMNHKPVLFTIVLKGAAIPETEPKTEIKDLKQENKYLKFKIDDLEKAFVYQATKNAANLAKTKQQEPEQTWTFSYEDLQEQSKLIEKLTTQNQQLSAELQILKKSKTNSVSVSGFDKFKYEKKIKELNDKIEKLEIHEHNSKELNITLLEEIDKLNVKINSLEYQLNNQTTK